mmetsp:Transcript_18032/g.41562  ORF Transcript_18032/g.41562 Transcript_18032/m.41562 type:complete len:80 (+) Transcript_18032:2058-2297(+)
MSSFSDACTKHSVIQNERGVIGAPKTAPNYLPTDINKPPSQVIRSPYGISSLLILANDRPFNQNENQWSYQGPKEMKAD